MKRPITTRTTGVTEAVIMSKDFERIAGIGILRALTIRPRITASRRGFFVKFLSIFKATSFLFLSTE